MSKEKLIQDYKYAIAQKRSGTHYTKIKYKQVMHNIMNELVEIGTLPKSWGQVNDACIEKLIQYWKEQGNTHRTISNKLGILRGVINSVKGAKCNFSENKHFITVAPKKVINALPELDLSNIENPLVLNIIEFEVQFGVTKLESMQLFNKISMMETLEHDNFVVNRSIAHNRHRRNIPVLKPQQKEIVKSRMKLIDKSARKISQIGLILPLYNAYVKYEGIPNNLRLYYLKHRGGQLRLNCNSEASVVKTLKQELGISDGSKVKKYLCHL